MKGLTVGLKQSSDDKWIEIEGHLINRDDIDYHSYWNECGFCKATKIDIDDDTESMNCHECNLFKKKIRKMVVCYMHCAMRSHALLTIHLANEGKYKEALPHCRIVLKAIRSTRIDGSK